jgi:uncharacterized protein (TIGR03437 family)
MRKNFPILIGLMVVASICALAQPAIRADNGVVNASSYQADIARGAWFVIFGTGLGPATLSVYSGAAPYPTSLSGTSVSFTPAGGGQATDARIWYTSAGQLAGLLPSGAGAGPYDVRVTYNNQTSAASRINVVERNFGFATQAQNGQGPAQATYGAADLNRFATGTLGQYSTRPAKIGDVVVLWGTGLGADNASDVNGGTSGDQTVAGNVSVVIDGIPVTPAYAGRSNGSPGLDQVNFVVPAGVNPGCFVSLQVRVGGRTSNFGSIAVVPAGQAACSHPAFTQAQLTKLDQGGTLSIGSLNASKLSTKLTVPQLGSITTSTESADGSFGKYTIADVATSPYGGAQIGQCYVLRRTGTQSQILLGTSPTPLDAGAQLTLSGPNANNIAMKQDASSKAYSATLYSSGFSGIGGSGTPTLVQGDYTIAGTGGPDVGAFSAKITVPGNFTSNIDNFSDPISRSSPLIVTWTGGANGLVEIVGISGGQTGGTTQNPTFDVGVFICTEQANKNTFMVPTSVLQQIPAVANDLVNGKLGMLEIATLPDVSQKQGLFTAPLTAGGSLDQAFFTYLIGSLKNVGWQ